MPDPTGGNGMGSVGFFGKLPGAGDFVQRRLPASFVERWDHHFEQAVYASREALGEAWSQAYQESPVWRFVIAPQVCGESAWAGVFGPAGDRVGRSFPMVLAAAVASAQIETLLRDGGSWFETLARVHVQGQRGAPVDAEGFDAMVVALPAPAMAAVAPVDPSLDPDFDRASHWRLPLPTQAIDTGALAALWRRLSGRAGSWCLWWSEGAGRVPAAMLATRGLPSPEAYAGFLDAALSGAWQTPPGVSMPISEPSVGTTPVAAPTAAAKTVALDDDVTLPGHMRQTHGAAPVRAPVAMAPAEPSVQAAPGAAVVRHPACALTLVTADAGVPDPRRRAAAAVASVGVELVAAEEAAPGTHALRARLMALHPHLRHTGLREDGAVVAARVAGTQAGLVRIGAASAWHWRGGRLRPLFSPAPTQPVQHAGGELDDLLFGGSEPAGVPGLGAEVAPVCEQIACDLQPGDRLVLLAGAAHTQLSLAALTQSLAAASAVEAQTRLAQSLGSTPSRPWPLAVIEVQS